MKEIWVFTSICLLYLLTDSTTLKLAKCGINWFLRLTEGLIQIHYITATLTISCPMPHILLFLDLKFLVTPNYSTQHFSTDTCEYPGTWIGYLVPKFSEKYRSLLLRFILYLKYWFELNWLRFNANKSEPFCQQWKDKL